MSKKNAYYVCQNCSHQSIQWVGKCPACEQWNSFVLEEESVRADVGSRTVSGLNTAEANRPVPVNQAFEQECERQLTGIHEFDRVLGGGLVAGSVILVGGEPGIGKSTLLMEVCGELSRQGNGKVLYISGEESTHQVATRARRLQIENEGLYLLHEANWQNIEEQIRQMSPSFIVIDSIQTVVNREIPSSPGTLTQIREVTYELVNLAKGRNMTCFIVGHVTKEGMIAGPKVLEHMVDVVIYFEGDQFGHYRILRAIKNRFGNVNEVGIFEMAEQGLVEVKNPSQLFLAHGLGKSFGRAITATHEGTRVLFVEIQALVVENKYGNGRRTTQGFDSNRLAMIIAVIEKYFGHQLGFYDVYVNVVGGMKISGREADLSVLAAILSSLKSTPVREHTLFLGEIGLTGEIRYVPRLDLILKEAAQMSYQTAITSRQNFVNQKGTATSAANVESLGLEVIAIQRADEIKDHLF